MVAISPKLRKLVLSAAFLLTGGLISAQAIAAKAPERVPNEELSEPILYGLLLGEIAAQRGDTALAARTYLELAKRTRDPRIARRAVELRANAGTGARGRENLAPGRPGLCGGFADGDDVPRCRTPGRGGRALS